MNAHMNDFILQWYFSFFDRNEICPTQPKWSRGNTRSIFQWDKLRFILQLGLGVGGSTMLHFWDRNRLAEPISFQVWFEFRAFLLFNQLPYQGKRISLPSYLLIAGGKAVGFMPFPRSISSMWNVNSLDQDLNSGSLVHFPWN